MKIIVGLGNIGKEYKKTRHNVGFMTVDKICSDLNSSEFNLNKKFNAEISETTFKEEKLIFVKPCTYMNLSGESVRKILDFYKETVENLIVIHDELDINIDNFKISKNRSSAGHKGVQSIIDNIGTKDFVRIRVGIGVEKRTIPTEKFVLQNFTSSEMENINKNIEEIIQKIKEELL